MGFPETGLDLWQLYDDNREMMIDTAYGPTDPIAPECGAWGQGAEESPMGWLCLMCWLSKHIDENSPTPYKYNVDDHLCQPITKTIYADDGNYFSSTRRGSQMQATAISHFCSSTGIVVKPTKSFIHSTEAGAPITLTTHDGDGRYDLGPPQTTALKELAEREYWRHLGNIQNSKGCTTIKNVTMHDGSIQINIKEKVKQNVIKNV